MTKKLIKNVSALAIGASLVTSTIVITPTTLPTTAKADSEAEGILNGLTPEQRDALKALTTNEKTGLHLEKSVNLNETKEVSVIVEFKEKTQKVAILEAQLKGKTLSTAAAKTKINDNHTIFKKDLETIFQENGKQKNSSYEINRTYKHAFNGVSMKLPANQVANLLKSNVVRAVYSDMKVQVEPPVELKEDKSSETSMKPYMADSVPFLGVDKLHQEGFTGKGVKVAVIDTGIDYNHPDLKNAYIGGFDFVDNDSDPMETTYEDWQKSDKPETDEDGNTFYTEHGTHVSGTISGQAANNSEYKTKGVAPDADIYGYRVLGPYGSGYSENVIAAIDKAVADGMDVMNLSLGARYNDPLYPTSIAINNAVLSGVTAVVSAGNSGSNMYTVGSPGTAALALTVGASDVSIELSNFTGKLTGQENITADLRLLAKGYEDDISKLANQTLEMVDVGLGGPTDYTGKDVKGKIALISRGSYALIEKVETAKKQGAVAALLYNNNPTEGHIPSYLGEGLHSLPTFSVTNKEGLTLKEKVSAGHKSLTFTDMKKIKTEGDTLAGFSSRGPSRVNYDIKPEITAPGVGVMSTIPSDIINKDKGDDYKLAYARLSGTSMAAPHVAGIAALMLQANKDLQPEDIKSILMNTADPLKGNYSVFEVGAGRVDPYEAIHANTKIKVFDKTEWNVDGKEKEIDEKTGAISFGSVPFSGKDFKDSRDVMIYNNDSRGKTFDVNVTFHTNLRGSKDAAKNGVKVTTDSSITVNGKSEKKSNVSISMPKEAEKGTYEGYVVYTNRENPTESYQIPFAVRYVEEGFETFTLSSPVLTTNNDVYDFEPITSVGATFVLKSHMRMIDVLLVDPKTGKDIGFLGSLDGIQVEDNTPVTIKSLFNGQYYPLTKDKDQPISTKLVKAKEGHYKIRMVGTNDNGKVFNAPQQDVFIDNTSPEKWDIKVAGEKAGTPFIEYKPNQKELSVSGFVFDKEIEKMKAVKIPFNQSKNNLYYETNEPKSKEDETKPPMKIALDEKGKFVNKIKVNNSVQPLLVHFDVMDAPKNFEGFFSNKEYALVKQGTPYVFGKPNKTISKEGDKVTFTLTANNVTNLKDAVFNFGIDESSMEVVDIKLTAAAKKLGVKKFNVKTREIGNDIEKTNISINFDGKRTVTGDIPMVDVTVKFEGDEDERLHAFGELKDMKSTFTDKRGKVTSPFTLVNKVFVAPSFSQAEGTLAATGFYDENGNLKKGVNYDKVGAKVTIKDHKGKKYTSSLNRDGQFLVTELPITKYEFTATVDVPGHFNTNTMFQAGIASNGRYYGELKDLHLVDAVAGDVNKDHVIDVMDAIALEENWKSNKRSADINFDGKVDVNDFAFVESNYLLQNDTVDGKVPTPKVEYKGKTLESIKRALGIR